MSQKTLPDGTFSEAAQHTAEFIEEEHDYSTRKQDLAEIESKPPRAGLKRGLTAGSESGRAMQRIATNQTDEGFGSEVEPHPHHHAALGVIPTERGNSHPSLWQNEDVIKWLFDIDLTSAVKPFSYHNLDGTDLEEVTEADLTQIGIKKLHDRKYLIRCIKKLFGRREAYLVVKNRAERDRILVNDIRVRLLNFEQITFGQVLDQCLRIWHLQAHSHPHPHHHKRNSHGNNLRLDLGAIEANDAYFLGDAEGNIFLNHAGIQGLFSESLMAFHDSECHEQQVVYLHRSSAIHESSLHDSARESLNAAKIEIERSNQSLHQIAAESRNPPDDVAQRTETMESDQKYGKSQFSRRSKDNAAGPGAAGLVVPAYRDPEQEEQEEEEETPSSKEERKEEIKQDKETKTPLSSDDQVDGVDIYNEEYDDDDTIEATRRGSSIYMHSNKMRLYTPSNPSSRAGVSVERNKSKSQFHISDNEDVLTMSDIDVSHDGGANGHGKSIQGTSSIIKHGDGFIDDPTEEEEEIQILSGNQPHRGQKRYTRIVGTRQRKYEDMPQPFNQVKHATISFKEKMHRLKLEEAERKRSSGGGSSGGQSHHHHQQQQPVAHHHAHHSSDVTDDISRRSKEYTSNIGTLVLLSRGDSSRYNTEPGGRIYFSGNDPDHITGGGIVSSGMMSSQTGSQEPSSREYRPQLRDLPEYEDSSAFYSVPVQDYQSQIPHPHTTSHAEQRRIVFEGPQTSSNRKRTIGENYKSFSPRQGKLINKLQMDLEKIQKDQSSEVAAPRSLYVQDLGRSAQIPMTGKSALLGDRDRASTQRGEGGVQPSQAPPSVSHYQLRYGRRSIGEPGAVSPVLYPRSIHHRI